MDKITFNDYEAPELGADNLNQLQTNIENAINGTVLYFDSTYAGTVNNITFSESISEGNSIEIIYRCLNNYKSSGKIPFIPGMNIILDIQERADSTAHSSLSKSVAVSTTGLTVNYEQGQTVWNGNILTPAIADITDIPIVKVVVYK